MRTRVCDAACAPCRCRRNISAHEPALDGVSQRTIICEYYDRVCAEAAFGACGVAGILLCAILPCDVDAGENPCRRPFSHAVRKIFPANVSA